MGLPGGSGRLGKGDDWAHYMAWRVSGEGRIPREHHVQDCLFRNV